MYKLCLTESGVWVPHIQSVDQIQQLGDKTNIWLHTRIHNLMPYTPHYKKIAVLFQTYTSIYIRAMKQ
jgi:hypothetical protein